MSLGTHVHPFLLRLYLGVWHCHSHVKISLALVRMKDHMEREANQVSQCTS